MENLDIEEDMKIIADNLLKGKLLNSKNEVIYQIPSAWKVVKN